MICLFQVFIFFVDMFPHIIFSRASKSKISAGFLYAAITLAGFWNLDFFRYIIPHFCISEDMSTLNIIAMEYIVAFYPLFLIIVIYIFIELYDKDFKPFQILWAPIKCVLSSMDWNIAIRHSLIDAFILFFTCHTLNLYL